MQEETREAFLHDSYNKKLGASNQICLYGAIIYLQLTNCSEIKNREGNYFNAVFFFIINLNAVLT